jgi:hypothetical protein
VPSCENRAIETQQQCCCQELRRLQEKPPIEHTAVAAMPSTGSPIPHNQTSRFTSIDAMVSAHVPIAELTSRL